MSRLPTPRSARFLAISLPSAPAPIKRILARFSRAWSHQEINSKRAKRPSDACGSICRTSLNRSSPGMPPLDLLNQLVAQRGAGGDLGLQTQDIPFTNSGRFERRFLQQLPAAGLVMELVAHE